MFSFACSQIINLSASSLFYFFSLFAYFAGVISKTGLPWRKSAPKQWGHMCVVAGAAASRWTLLAAPSLHPVVCQAAKQGKRWDKWLFMICHLLSSRLSPGPIHYGCRLPLCLTRRAHKHTHTHTFSVHVLLDNVYRQTNIHAFFSPHAILSI